MHPARTPISPRNRGPRAWLLAGLLLALGGGLPGCAAPAHSAAEISIPAPVDLIAPRVGPARGYVMVAGGGTLGTDIWDRFVALAGGPEARIVVVPTAGTDEVFPEDWSGFQALRRAGAVHLQVLHTRDRAEADSEAFVAALRTATGVWIPGGRQWRLVDSYLGTRVQEELEALLFRGGIVGGTSAGASIQAEYLVRGDPATNQTLMAPGYEVGFNFLRGTAVDQHLLARGRENDLWEVLAVHPYLLGIGLDEGTALLVQGDQGEVLGVSDVLIYDPDREPREALVLRQGDRFDLRLRSILPPAR
jgi:cyanophycinase